jgi:hypothetical protein
MQEIYLGSSMSLGIQIKKRLRSTRKTGGGQKRRCRQAIGRTEG